MASPAAAADPPVDGSVRPAQRARRERMLDAAVGLASEGGYDRVQMRGVAERSGVALGTLYRYFPSKINLLVSAMVREIERIKVPSGGRLAAVPPAERVVTVLTRATRIFQRDPNLAGALLRAVMFADPGAAAEVDQVTQLMNAIIVRTMRGDADPPTAREVAIAGLIEKVWFASQIAWLSGRTRPEQVVEDLDLAVRMLVP